MGLNVINERKILYYTNLLNLHLLNWKLTGVSSGVLGMVEMLGFVSRYGDPKLGRDPVYGKLFMLDLQSMVDDEKGVDST